MSKFKVGDIVQHNYDSSVLSGRSIKIKVEDGEPFDSTSFLW